MTAAMNRRQSERRDLVKDHGIVAARIRPGREVRVIDASAGGLLIESEHRLLPGTMVDVHLEGVDRSTCVRGQVLWSCVADLQPSSVLYRGVVAFEFRLSWCEEPCAAGYLLPVDERQGSGVGGHLLPTERHAQVPKTF
jgi:hypothetical protein